MTLVSPNRIVHHFGDLVPYYVVDKGEPFEMDDEDMGQPPDRHLLSGFSMLLTLRTVPAEESNIPLHQQIKPKTILLEKLHMIVTSILY